MCCNILLVAEAFFGLPVEGKLVDFLYFIIFLVVQESVSYSTKQFLSIINYRFDILWLCFDYCYFS